MAGHEEPSTASPSWRPARPSACSSRSPSSTRRKDVRGTSRTACAPLRDLLDRFNEISAKFAEPDADFDALLAEQATVQDAIDRRDAWSLDATARPRDGRAPPARRRPRRRRRSRAASGGASRSAGCSSPRRTCCFSTSRRTTRRRVRRLARALPRRYKGTVVAVTHDRYFLDNVAGWILELDRGRGIPFQGNYSSWLEQKQARLAVEEKQESARRRTLAARARVGADEPEARHAKSKARLGAYEQAASPRSRHVKLDRVEIHIPSGPRLGDVVIEADGVAKGFGDRLLFEDLTFCCRRPASSAWSARTAPARRRSSG